MIAGRRFIPLTFFVLAAWSLCAPGVRAQQPEPPAEAPAEPPAKGNRLSGAEAWKTLLGNSATGKTKDGMRADYYGADGTIKTQIDDDLQSGKWRLEGNRVCIEYAQDDGDDDEDDDGETCYRISITGSVVIFLDDDGEGIRLRIVPGNPKKL